MQITHVSSDAPPTPPPTPLPRSRRDDAAAARHAARRASARCAARQAFLSCRQAALWQAWPQYQARWQPPQQDLAPAVPQW